MYKKLLFSCLAAGTLFLSNCKPDEEDEIVPTAVVAPEITIPSSIKNVDGVMLAINTISKTSGVALEVGTAHAVFYKSQNPSNKLDAGKVMINAYNCTKSDENVYFFSPTATEKGGIDYNSQINWEVSGNTANGISAIDDNDGTGFPNLPSLSEIINLDVNSDFQINWATAAGGDSVMVYIKGPKANFKTTLPGGTSKYTLAKAEIAKLGIGTANLFIINYKVGNRSYGGKTYAFIKQSVAVCSKVNIE